MKLERVYLYHLSAGLHLQFVVEVRNIIWKFNPNTLKIEPQYEVLRICIEKEDLCYKNIRKSNISELKMNSDQARDSLVTGTNETLKTAHRHHDIKVVEAAQRLQVVFDKYNKPVSLINLPYDAETLAIDSLLQELETNHASDVEITGLKSWITELRVRNTAFQELAKAYIEEQAAKPSLYSKDVRFETDKAYKDIATVINALIIMEGEEKYAPFVSELNTLIKHYNDLAMQHLGRVRAKKEKAQKKKEEQEKKEQEEKVQGTDEKGQGTSNKV
jgi:hypothetical protein